METIERISFVNLSDIHFHKYSGSPTDIDTDLRNELLNDIRDFAKPKLGKFTGVLVCGDIAYSGKEVEYLAARIV